MYQIVTNVCIYTDNAYVHVKYLRSFALFAAMELVATEN